MPSRRQLAIDVIVGGDHARETEARGDDRPALFTMGTTHGRLVDITFEGRTQGNNVVTRDQRTGLARHNQFRIAADRGGNHRQAGRHGFEYGVGNALGQ